MDIDVVVLDIERIAGGLSSDELAPECLPHVGDEISERTDCVLRKIRRPDRLHKGFGREDLARTQQQHGQQQPLLASAQLYCASCDRYLEWPEQTKFIRPLVRNSAHTANRHQRKGAHGRGCQAASIGGSAMRRSPVPSAFMTKSPESSSSPRTAAPNAMCPPSGDHVGPNEVNAWAD
jgi:hypothetical protein